MWMASQTKPLKKDVNTGIDSDTVLQKPDSMCGDPR